MKDIFRVLLCYIKRDPKEAKKDADKAKNQKNGSYYEDRLMTDYRIISFFKRQAARHTIHEKALK